MSPCRPGCRAVLLPGGYPELHAGALAASRRSLDLAAPGRRGRDADRRRMRWAAAAGPGAWRMPTAGRTRMAGSAALHRRAAAASAWATARPRPDSDGLLVRRGERLLRP